jgi:hypothetical protein
MPLSDTLDHLAAGLAQALLIGLLLGLERERARGSEEGEGFAGIRTFPLFMLAGFLAAVLVGPAPLALPALLIAVAALAVAFQVVGPAGKGASTETAALLAVLLGAAVGFGRGPLAAAVRRRRRPPAHVEGVAASARARGVGGRDPRHPQVRRGGADRGWCPRSACWRS